jgi:prepilin-type N-terminal cleavage/methylation domain-containing protein
VTQQTTPLALRITFKTLITDWDRKKTFMKAKFNEKGVTLIELMVALVICGIIVAAIYRLFVAQARSYTVQDQVAESQQNVRNAMELLLRDIRMAGFDDDMTPIQPPNPPITPGANSIVVYYEYNGVIRQVTYALNGTTLMRNQIPPDSPPAEPGGDPILENVNAFTLMYGTDSPLNDRRLHSWVSAGAVPAGANIVAVRVQLSAKPTGDPDLDKVSPRSLNTVVAIRNQIK